ncbi:MAG: hypothetical protein V1760_00335 [Candidatus Peregrinibacteria bacterium]
MFSAPSASAIMSKRVVFEVQSSLHPSLAIRLAIDKMNIQGLRPTVTPTGERGRFYVEVVETSRERMQCVLEQADGVTIISSPCGGGKRKGK